MKNVIIGVIVGMAVALPASALAFTDKQVAGTIFGASCGSSYNGNRNCGVTVYKYTNGRDNCYVAVGGSHEDVPAISCLNN